MPIIKPIIVLATAVSLGVVPLIPERVSAVPEGSVWVVSYTTIGFDTPTGDLTEGYFARSGKKALTNPLFQSDNGSDVCYQGNNPTSNRQFSTVFCSQATGTEVQVSGESSYHVFKNWVEYRVKAEKKDYESLRTEKRPSKTVYKSLIQL